MGGAGVGSVPPSTPMTRARPGPRRGNRSYPVSDVKKTLITESETKVQFSYWPGA